MREEIKNATLTRALADILADAGELLRKEAQLARAEITQALSAKAQAAVWYGVAGLFALLALFLLAQAAIFAIASFGIPMHWACLIVAIAMLAIGLGAFFLARSGASAELYPSRTVNQIKQDIATIKGQWS